MAWMNGGAAVGAARRRWKTKVAGFAAAAVVAGALAVGVGGGSPAHAVGDPYKATWFPSELWVNPFADPLYAEQHCLPNGDADVDSHPYSAPEPGGPIRAMADGQVVTLSPLVIVHQSTTGPLDAVYRGVTPKAGLTVGAAVLAGSTVGTDPDGDGALGLWKVPAGGNPADIDPAPAIVGCAYPAGWIFLPDLANLQPADADVDRDGVPNGTDRCDGVAGAAAWNGCGSNLLRNGSFERGNNVGWDTSTTQRIDDVIATLGGAVHAPDGDFYAKYDPVAPAGATVPTAATQQMAIVPTNGESYNASLWVRSQSATPKSVTLTLGQGATRATATRTVGPDWTLMTVTYDATGAAGPLQFRVVSAHVANDALLFDGAQVVRNLAAGGSFESGLGGWGAIAPATAVSATDASVIDGTKAASVTSTSAAGGLTDDIPVAPQVGTAYTLTAWVKAKQTAAVPMTVTLAASGGSPEAASTDATVGPDWTPLSVTLDSTSAHTGLTASITGGGAGLAWMADTVLVTPTPLRNSSFEEGTLAGWTQTGGADLSLKPGVAHDGSASLNLHVATAHQAIAGRVAPGASYTVNAWARTTSTVAQFGELTLTGIGGPGGNEFTTALFQAGPDWTLISTTFDVGSFGHDSLDLSIKNTSDTAADLLIDSVTLTAGGARSSGLLVHPTKPSRLVETRPNKTTIDGQQNGIGRRAAGSTTIVKVGGRAGVPSNATAAELTITAVRAGARGFVTVWPCSQSQPTGSSVNVAAGGTAANTVITGMSGDVCVYTSAPMDLLVDLGGYVPSGADYVAVGPGRLVETRPGLTTFDGQQNGIGRRATGSVTEVQVAGRVNVPGSATAVALNVTAVGAGARGFLTAWPCGAPKPVASSLNVAAGATTANAIMVKPGVGGKVCVFTSVPTDLLVDVTGYVRPTANFTGLTPARLYETRPGQLTIDGGQAGVGRLAAGATAQVVVGGRAGVPTHAELVALNVTAVSPGAAGFLTVWNCTNPRPVASTVNFAANTATANSVLSAVHPIGRVCVYTSVATDLVVDVVGYQYPPWV
jgi:hypothetical protein